MGFYQKGPWVASPKKPYHTPDNQDPIIQCSDCPVLLHKDEAMLAFNTVNIKTQSARILICIDCYRKRRATA